MSAWIKKELRGGKHYPGGDEDVQRTLRDLNTEFKSTFGELSEKTLSVPRDLAKKISQDHDVSLPLGMVAYQISQDGILPAEEACELLKREYTRLESINHAVPGFESAQIDFAVKEGQWIEYLYKKFARQVNDRVSAATTVDLMLTSQDIPLEKILLVVYEREKLTSGFLTPVLDEWRSSHRRASAFQAAIAIVEVILKSPNNSEKAKLALAEKVENARKIVSKLESAVRSADLKSLSEREKLPIKRIVDGLKDTLSEMDSPLESMSESALAEIVAELVPIKTGAPAPIEKGSYIVVTVPTPKYGELQPLMKDPYDFLERDIRLAKRREDSKEFLAKTVDNALRVLSEGNPKSIDVAADMVAEMHDRFKCSEKPNREELIAKLMTFVHEEQTEDLRVVEEVDSESLCSFLSDYFIEKLLKPGNDVAKPSASAPAEETQSERTTPE